MAPLNVSYKCLIYGIRWQATYHSPSLHTRHAYMGCNRSDKNSVYMRNEEKGKEIRRKHIKDNEKHPNLTRHSYVCLLLVHMRYMRRHVCNSLCIRK